MKCPNCKTDGGYQPLLRKFECASKSCELYIESPKVHYAIHSVDIKNKNNDIYTSFDPKAIGPKPSPLDIKVDVDLLKKYMSEAMAVPVIMAPQKLDYSKIRPRGEPISKPNPLEKMRISEKYVETNHFSHTSRLHIVLDGYFSSEQEMEEVLETLSKIFDKQNLHG